MGGTGLCASSFVTVSISDRKSRLPPWCLSFRCSPLSESCSKILMSLELYLAFGKRRTFYPYGIGIIKTIICMTKLGLSMCPHAATLASYSASPSLYIASRNVLGDIWGCGAQLVLDYKPHSLSLRDKSTYRLKVTHGAGFSSTDFLEECDDENGGDTGEEEDASDTNGATSNEKDSKSNTAWPHLAVDAASPGRGAISAAGTKNKKPHEEHKRKQKPAFENGKSASSSLTK